MFTLRRGPWILIPLLLTMLLTIAPGCEPEESSGPARPTVEILAPGVSGSGATGPFSRPHHGPVRFEVRLSDPEGAPLDLTVEYALAGRPFRPIRLSAGSPELTRLSATPGGVTHHFTWNAGADLGSGRFRDVAIRVTPRSARHDGAPVVHRHLQLDTARRPVPRSAQAALRLDRSCLLVTHASRFWGDFPAIQAGLDRLIATLEAREDFSILYLMVDKDPSGSSGSDWDHLWGTAYTAPTHAVYSTGGEHGLTIRSGDLTIVGGYARACMMKTGVDAIRSHARSGVAGALVIHFPMPLIFRAGRHTLADTYRDSYFGDPKLFHEWVVSGYAARPELKGHGVRVFVDGKPTGTLRPGASHVVDLHFWSTVDRYLAGTRS